MPELHLPEISLHYQVTGSGPPLLLFAGFMSDSASWTPLVPFLSPHFTLIMPDNRTTGRTTPWNAPISVEAMAADGLALLDHLGHDRAHVAGHSMGGIVALDMARQAASRIASLSVLASAPVRLERNSALFRALLAIRQSDAPPDTWLRALFPWLFSTAVYEQPNLIEEAVAASLAYPYGQSAEAMAHQLAALEQFDGSHLTEPACPAQAILAENDLIIPLSHADAVLSAMPRHVVENAGHSVHWDDPQAVARHIREFTALTPVEAP